MDEWHEQAEVPKARSLLLREEVFAIYGAAIEVHKCLGSGYLEAVYQEALEIELGRSGVPFESQKPLAIRYKDVLLTKGCVADPVCYGKILVELKASTRLTTIDEAQLLNYLKATGFRVGLLINFGSSGTLERKRLVR